MNERLRAVLVGVGVAVAVLLLADLSDSLRASASRQAASGPLRWWLLVQAGAGAAALYGAAWGRRDPLAPLVAGGLLAWPFAPLLWTALPAPPAWLPLLGSATFGFQGGMLLVGVLLAGGLAARRLP